MTAPTTSKRQAWIDYLRVICIIEIVLFHTPPRLIDVEIVNYYLVALSIGVPCFILASGLVYNGNKYPSLTAFVKHRVRQLLVPYFAFSIIFYLLWIVVGRRLSPDDAAVAWWQPLLDMVLGKPSVVCAPLWFVSCLFSMQIVYNIIERLVPRRLVFASSLGLSLLYLTVSALLPDVDTHIDVWKISDMLFFLPVYAAGNCFKRQLSQWRPNAIGGMAATALTAAGLTLGYLVLMAFYGHPITISDTTITPAWFVDDRAALIRLLAVFMSLPLFIALAKWCQNLWGERQAAARVASYGVFYLAAQNYAIGIYKIAAGKLLGEHFIDNAYPLKYVIALVIIAALTAVATLLDRYCPTLLGHRHRR